MAKLTAQIVMTTNSKSLTFKSDDTPIRLMAPKGKESALDLQADAKYAVCMYPVPAGYRAVTADEMEQFDKPQPGIVKFWSTKSNTDGAWKGVKDKEDITWHTGVPYIVPADYEFYTAELVVNGEVVVDQISEEQVAAIVTLLGL